MNKTEKVLKQADYLVKYKPKEKGTYYPKQEGCCWNYLKKQQKVK